MRDLNTGFKENVIFTKDIIFSFLHMIYVFICLVSQAFFYALFGEVINKYKKRRRFIPR